MHILYTRHARQRMRQRKVSEELVRDILESPDEIIEGDLDEQIAIRSLGIREVRVVYEEIDVDIVLVYTVIKARLRYS